ncbi:MAG: bifunctional folylpolyglutamate synthase/dihydrofolate synthase [Syntrophorhabdaceae bacterium]|nr:bifunctional folylpolyglutamate synthase/dihydrofolate synthase [Syntrophorhabdaceae bacterium]
MKGYSESMEYLSGLERSGILFGLDNIKWILESIDNPQNKLKCVHVAGTNGKGSVSTMLSFIMKESGYRVGKYTSPHLVRFNERIVIDEKEIDDSDIVEIIDFIREKIERRGTKRKFSYFDFTTAMAFEYFYRKKVDIAIIEVGLGGRLDSTNVILPLVSIITNVELDHTDYLGNSLEEVAREKSGIIKERIPVVTGVDKRSISVIEEVAGQRSSPLLILGRDFFYKKQDEQVMTYGGHKKTLEDLYINLMGDHQLNNASIALCVIELLAENGYNIPDRAIYNGLANVKWPGRLEVVRREPTIILDGAHNLHAIGVLSQFIEARYVNTRKILIFGVLADKDYKGMLKRLIPIVDTVIFTKPDTQRALSPYKMANLVDNCIVTEDVKSALNKAMTLAGKDELILITGSLYTVGEAKKLLDEVF